MTDEKSTPTDASFWKTQPFRIIELVRGDPPEADDNREWYRYVISQGDKPITGLRQGSKRSVKAAVDEVVLRLNERRMGKRPSQRQTSQRQTNQRQTKSR